MIESIVINKVVEIMNEQQTFNENNCKKCSICKTSKMSKDGYECRHVGIKLWFCCSCYETTSQEKILEILNNKINEFEKIKNEIISG